MKRLAGLVLVFGLGVFSFSAQSEPLVRAPKTKNVILFMMDGVRIQEFFEGSDKDLGGDGRANFPWLFSKQFGNAAVFGDLSRLSFMKIVNSSGVSLPGYQTLMAGHALPCVHNECGRITVETFMERLIKENRFEREQVATIASWERVKYATTREENLTFENAGNVPLVDSRFDAEADAINTEQMNNPPIWGEARADRYTVAHAFRYLRVHQPRFLFISLDDSDEHGHRGDYVSLTTTLRQYDQWLKQLKGLLDSMGDYGRETTVLITTDHGRGTGPDGWKNHGTHLMPNSARVFLYATGPDTLPINSFLVSHSHGDLRPTIEAFFGLEPRQCTGCGKPMTEVLGLGRGF